MINYRAEAPQLRAQECIYIVQKYWPSPIFATLRIIVICNYIFTGIHTSAFGLGTMVYIGLEFGSWFEIPWDSPCYQVHFRICVNIFVNIQIFLGCARSEPSSTNHFHLLPNVFCLHELSGNYN